MAGTDFVVDKDNLEVRMERIFRASPERMWQAFTRADQIPKWWGPSSLTTTVEKLDVQIGGEWRFIQTDKAGEKYVFYGVYKEVQEPKKLVYTFEYEPFAGHVIVETVELLDQGDGTTKVTDVSVYANKEDLEGMVQAGMEEGAVEGMERLAELVE